MYFFVSLRGVFVSRFASVCERGRGLLGEEEEVENKGKKEKGAPFAPASLASPLAERPIRSPFLLHSLPLIPILTLLAKSYLKPEYLSLGFFQSETFSSTAATTCDSVRRIEVFSVVKDLGSEDNLAAAAERLVVVKDAVEVIDADLREDTMLVQADCKIEAEGTDKRGGGRDEAKETMLQRK